ncbi:peptidase S8/S53 domain-containing protein [Radiomyces spectabilis]|uniref:peptidase S8/S53 domain-containing protein n=1 Tax=Radiomyces spectabilis TaxID=64574 RepID=UPI00222118E5|nr:peptidase S8/S53 domain-containing protein [Radiomyces spectabilis]KAI8379322.1 peptidase S8/S53 domain-containing protein [Radiomyces spectabilis]
MKLYWWILPFYYSLVIGQDTTENKGSTTSYDIGVFTNLPSSHFLDKLRFRGGQIPLHNDPVSVMTFDDNLHIVVNEAPSPEQRQLLKDHPDCASIEQNRLVHAAQVNLNTDPSSSSPSFSTPAASHLASQDHVANWGLARIAQRNLPLGSTFTYPDTAGEGVDIYIVDSGVNIDHEDLRGRAYWGITTIDEPDTDTNGHGTFVAGIAAGTQNGVAKKAHIIAVKTLNAKAAGTVAEILRGLHFIKLAAERSGRKSIVNLSVLTSKSVALNEAIESLTRAGLLITSAAGNHEGENDDVNACHFSPASSPSSITVGSTDKEDVMAQFSNRGPCVDIFAPGVNVVSDNASSEKDTKKASSGTSFSCPHVSGVAALMFAAENITAQEVKRRILAIATTNTIRHIPKDGTPNVMLFTGISSSESGDSPVYTAMAPDRLLKFDWKSFFMPLVALLTLLH